MQHYKDSNTRIINPPLINEQKPLAKNGDNKIISLEEVKFRRLNKPPQQFSTNEVFPPRIDNGSLPSKTISAPEPASTHGKLATNVNRQPLTYAERKGAHRRIGKRALPNQQKIRTKLFQSNKSSSTIKPSHILPRIGKRSITSIEQALDHIKQLNEKNNITHSNIEYICAQMAAFRPQPGTILGRLIEQNSPLILTNLLSTGVHDLL